MNELINQITSRTGVSEDQARQAVDIVISFAKSKLPEPLASQIDGFLANDSTSAGMIDQVQQQIGNLGGLFGGKE